MVKNAVAERHISLGQCLEIIQCHKLLMLTNAWTSVIQIDLVSFGTMAEADADFVRTQEAAQNQQVLTAMVQKNAFLDHHRDIQVNQTVAKNNPALFHIDECSVWNE